MRRTLLQITMAGVLALGVAIAAQAPAPSSGEMPAPGPKQEAQLQGRARVVQALNRLTWGIEPGEVDAVQKMGLQRWIDLQLHPNRIPENPDLTAALAGLDTLTMSTGQMLAHYPPVQLINQMAQGKRPLPTDPKLRAVVEREIAAEQARGKALGKANRTGRGGRNGPGAAGARLAQFPQLVMADDAAEPDAPPLNTILNPDQIAALEKGPMPNRVATLEGLPTITRDEVLASLPARFARPLAPWVPVSQAHQIAYNLMPQQVIPLDLTSDKVLRAVYSNRQLEDVLTDFWFNHFNVYIAKGPERNLITAYERDDIRPHVLGKFRDLLLATAESPAMLYFLDNWQSVDPQAGANAYTRQQIARAMVNAVRARRGLPPLPPILPRPAAGRRGLNENYGREIMELHTVGLHYTQADVIAAARCLTGWTIAQPLVNPRFVFNPAMHDPGAKVVLGMKIPAGGGMSDGLKLIDMLAASPYTAQHISYELAQRFVADNPPPNLVARMAATYMKSDGDLRQVMETMIDSPEFWSPAYQRAKMKSPLEFVVSSVRALGADVSNPMVLVQQIGAMGEPLYGKQPPTGYSNDDSDWASSSDLVDRFNFAMRLAHNQIPGVQVDLTQFDHGTGLAGYERALYASLLDGDVSATTRAAINKSIGAAVDRPTTLPEMAQIAGLVLGSPEFQRR